MGGSESQPKANRRTTPGAKPPPALEQNKNNDDRNTPPREQNEQSRSSAPINVARRPTVEELLLKVRDGIVTTHTMISALPPGPEGSQMRSELEKRLMLLLSYEERLVFAQQGDRVPAPKHEQKKRLHPAVSQCPRIIYNSDHVNCDEEEKRTCSICWDDYKVGDTVLILPCLHWIHAHCGEEWLLRKPQCPICQIDVIQSLRNCASYAD